MPETVLTLTIPERMHETDRLLFEEAVGGMREWMEGGGPKHLRVAIANLKCLLILQCIQDDDGETWDGEEPIAL